MKRQSVFEDIVDNILAKAPLEVFRKKVSSIKLVRNIISYYLTAISEQKHRNKPL